MTQSTYITDVKTDLNWEDIIPLEEQQKLERGRR